MKTYKVYDIWRLLLPAETEAASPIQIARKINKQAERVYAKDGVLPMHTRIYIFNINKPYKHYYYGWFDLK